MGIPREVQIVKDSKDSDCNTTSIIPDASLLLNYGKKGLVMGNQYTQENSYAIKLNTLLKNIEKNCPEWEYVSGYTHSDGRVILRNKICGHEKDVSCITIRKISKRRNRTTDQTVLVCRVCEEQRKREAEQVKHKRIEYEQFVNRKPAKVIQMQIRECTQCGAFFYDQSGRHKYCSKECAKRVQNAQSNRKKDFRRRVSKTEESNSINLQALYKRDKGICWLCGKPCDMSLDGNDNYYPSIDHIIPIARGGKDRWDNVKLAHRICNTLKSDHLFTLPHSLTQGEAT